MARIANDPGGRRRILFVDPNGNRKAIRLGKVSQRSADGFKYRVEQLLEALLLKQPMPADLAAWVNDQEPRMAKKLAAVGLIPKREAKRAARRPIGAMPNELCWPTSARTGHWPT